MSSSRAKGLIPNSGPCYADIHRGFPQFIERNAGRAESNLHQGRAAAIRILRLAKMS